MAKVIITIILINPGITIINDNYFSQLMNEAFTTHSPPVGWLTTGWESAWLIPQFECQYRWRSGSFNQQPKSWFNQNSINCAALQHSSNWMSKGWMTLDKIKGHLVAICIWKDPVFYFAEATSTHHRIWNQSHHWRTRMINTPWGSRHPSLPPFKRVGWTLWLHSHSHWESTSGKAGVSLWNSVIFALISK